MVGPVVGPVNPPASGSAPRRVDDAVDALIAAVLDGTYRTGSVLPPERELAPQLGVSRTSLRQAITRLEQLGVVAPHQGRGTTVLDITDTTDPELIRRIAADQGGELVGELFEVRQAMGALAGRLAARRATPADLRALDASLAEVTRAEGIDRRQRAELDFFGHLVDAAGNRPLRTMLRWAERAYGASAEAFAGAFADRDEVVSELGAIVDAVRSGDGDGSAAAVEHYAEQSGRRMLDALAVGGPHGPEDADPPGG